VNFNPIILSIPIFFVLIGVELVYSWVANKKLYRLGDAFANIGCGIFEQVTGLFAKVFVIGLYSVVYQNFRFFDVPINGWTIFLLFLGVDFFYYWAHRYSHQVNLFWIGHVVHHQSEDYNLSVALRQGALQKIFTAPFALPLALLGFSDEWFLYISAFNTLYQFWIHTEAIGKLGPLEWVLNTPSHHRVHHGRDPKYIDKNHAGSLIIWDRMFGTFQAEEEKPHYGITKPTTTFNPVKAHWLPVKQLADDVGRVRGWQKLKLLFMPPGWLPKENGGPQKPLPVEEATYRKFDFLVNHTMGRYLFSQFVLLLTFSAYFLFTYATFDTFSNAINALFICLSLLALGALFEGRKWAKVAEVIRLVVFMRLVDVGEPIIAYSGIAILMVSLLAFLYISRSFKPATLES
jgi:sterol desaturase/sphingolipid hydroxylase (fatty acid hydroxylase superfamily)